jgi:hypothetical protein
MSQGSWPLEYVSKSMERRQFLRFHPTIYELSQDIQAVLVAIGGHLNLRLPGQRKGPGGCSPRPHRFA